MSEAGWAQSAPSGPIPPVRSTVDENGVNVVNGQMMITAPSLTMGTPSGPNISFTPVFDGFSWSHNYEMTAYEGPYEATVVMGGSIDKLATPSTNPVYAYGQYMSTKGNGAGGGGGNYALRNFTYGEQSGVQTTLSNLASDLNGGGNGFYYRGKRVSQAATLVQKRNQEFLLLYYKRATLGSDVYVRLSSVVSSFGFQIKLSYANDTLNSLVDMDSWNRISQVQLINNAQDYCDPYADHCTGLTQSAPALNFSYQPTGGGSEVAITDAMGFVSTYGLDASGKLSYIKNPSRQSGNPAVNMAIAYDGNGNVSTLVRNGVSYNYSFSQSANRMTSVLNGPNGAIRTVVSDTDTGTTLSTSDALGNVTTNSEDTYGRITQTTLPEGNVEQYSYDRAGNVIQQTSIPKPGSSLGNLVRKAAYYMRV